MHRTPLYNEGVYAIALGSGTAAFILLLSDHLDIPDVVWIPLVVMGCGALFSLVVSLQARQNPILPLLVAAVVSAVIFGVIYFWIGSFF